MKLLCFIFGHRWKDKGPITIIGPGEPLPNGRAAYGFPEIMNLFECSRCKRRRYLK
jgi:hypothetical protein